MEVSHREEETGKLLHLQVLDVGACWPQQDSGHIGAVLWKYLECKKRVVAKNIVETEAKI